MSFLPVEDHALSSCTSPPLLPPETLKNLSQLADNGGCFTDNDLVEAMREENETKIAAIIGKLICVLNSSFMYCEQLTATKDSSIKFNTDIGA